MARRRGRRVPYAEWVKAFAIYNTAVAKGYDEWVRTTPERVPFAFGAVFRIVLAKIALPKLHFYLREGKDIVDAVKQAISDAANLVVTDKGRRLVEAVLKQLGIQGNTEEYVKLIKEAAGFIEANLENLLEMAEELYGVKPGEMAVQVQAQEQAPVLTATA